MSKQITGRFVIAVFRKSHDSMRFVQVRIFLDLFSWQSEILLCRTLLSLYAVFEKLPKTKEVIDEVLLLLNMAKHHPAFKFEQRAAVAELTEEILHRWKQRMNCSSANRSEAPSPSSGVS